jgi:hypothetical protein
MPGFLWAFGACGLKALRWIKEKESSGSVLFTNIEQAIRGIASLVPQVGDEVETHAEK